MSKAFALAAITRDRSLVSERRLHNTNQGDKVQPTEHIAKSASMPKIGRFATFRGLFHLQGSGAPMRGLIVIPMVGLCTLGALFALSTAVAQAEAPKLIFYGSFGSVTTDPVGIAVDQPSGDVYVAGFYDESQPPIDEFDASEKLISPPSPFGEGIHSAAAVDPTNGDLYLLNAFGKIETYDPSTGGLVSPPFEVPGSDNVFGVATAVQIASDSAGDVYVPVIPKNEVLEYNSTGVLLKTFTGSGALKEPTGVAVAPSGDVWVADTGNNRIEELSPTDVPIGEIRSEGVRSVVFNGRGDLLAIVKNSADFCGSLKSPCSHLVDYSPAGMQLADVGAGSFGNTEENIELPSMVAVNESSGRVYVTDPYKERVVVFGPPVVPAVEKEFSAEVGTVEAKLGALVNPGGIATSYRIEYGITTAYGQATPFPEGSVGEGLTSHTVWAAASGLSPGATYHYRVVATNELGIAVGPDRTFTTETSAQATCPNEQVRSGFSAGLPDCRADELVTPLTKTSVEIRGASAAARDGNAIAFLTHEPLPGAATGGNDYVARRGTGGWRSEDLIPLESYTGTVCVSHSNSVEAYSDELSRTLISFGRNTRASEPGGSELESQECNAEGVEAASGEPVGYQNLLLRDNETGGFQLVNALEPGLTSVPADAYFQGASADLSHVVFTERTPLTANAPVGAAEDLYEWDEGVVRLLTVLPDGAPVTGSLAEGRPNDSRAISADGSAILFTSGGDLYARLGGLRTVQVDASHVGGTGGGGRLMEVSPDGSRVFFSDEASVGLTADTVPGSGANLYEYDFDSGTLTDLTVAASADVQHVVAVSEDGSYVYFLAEGSVATGAAAGQNNLYLFHDGMTTFIATLAAQEDYYGGQSSPDGAWLAFTSTKSLTGYDNTMPGGVPASETYLYNAASNQLTCASCNPSGEPPALGDAGEGPVTDSGQVFFTTAEALVPSDTNDQSDVYEYEDGEPHLISSGSGAGAGAELLDVSENGDDVFFLTQQRLVPQDTEEEVNVIYDARVDGGFPVSTSQSCTTADACRAAVSPQPLIYGAPPSQTFSGTGNVAAPAAPKPTVNPKSKPAKCRRGFAVKKGRCVRKPTKKAKKSVHSSKAGK